MDSGAAAVADALDFLDPLPIRFKADGYVVEVKPLGLFEWLRYERGEERALRAFLDFEFAQGLSILVELMEVTSSVQFGDVPVGEALVAFAHLVTENNCEYIDPYFLEATRKRIGGVVYVDELASRSIFDMVMVLAKRFSMDEIEAMSPEMAFLAYQYILDEQAEDRTVQFYLSEMGYEKQKMGKGKNMKIKLKPLKTPYLTPWLAARQRAIKQARIKTIQSKTPPVSRLIKHPEKVVDLRKGRSRNHD